MEQGGSGVSKCCARYDCTYESALHGKDGSTVPVEVHARRVEFEETDSVQWILRDITERKELDGCATT